MGREIRRVPADWEHPRFTKDTARRREEIGKYMPLYDDDFDTAADRWESDFALWRKGKHPYQTSDDRFWEFESPPDRELHRERKWTKAEATHYQAYETVSEGTPVTPHFATKQELAEYLVKHGDFWDQDPRYGSGKGWSRDAAENFVELGDAPSLVISGGKVFEPRDGIPKP